jgi:hypothetical protein
LFRKQVKTLYAQGDSEDTRSQKLGSNASRPVKMDGRWEFYWNQLLIGG